MMDEAQAFIDIIERVIELGSTGMLIVAVIALWLRLRWTQNKMMDYQEKIAKIADERAADSLSSYKQIVLQSQSYVPSGLTYNERQTVFPKQAEITSVGD